MATSRSTKTRRSSPECRRARSASSRRGDADRVGQTRSKAREGQRVPRRVLAALLFAIAATTAAFAPAGTARAAAEIAAAPLAGRDLLAALRRGGYVIYFRH